ncbi:peptidase M14 [Alteromonas pelagimontana]|uniref:Peptidase M14 n=2 Tax=Alteromonas pelagimontana TaxID=1858656 RepID=A0A6M4MHX6_9ALTE|nr:peptidase M14 [Alteromonas pelagimontana]
MNKGSIAHIVYTLAAALLLTSPLQAAPFYQSNDGGRPASTYLPGDISYDPTIPSPEAVLGANVGAWHVRHDQLVHYMKVLADASPRVTLQETGRTHENRPLLLLTITAEKNQQKIDSIKAAHQQAIEAGKRVSSSAPLIFYMGYSIHGNEPSGSNAALLIAYYLAAGQGGQIDALLEDNIVLLDPALNPDGLARFAQWANMHKGKNLVADPNHREHEEGWPSGRSNHYWFDLNRDWLLLTHPESRARISQFQQWRPHILTDFHEMGSDSTFFFQPGVPTRKNPFTPDGNVTLTEALAKFHAKAFDDAKELYFSEEGFDDFYYGKGSSYPDAHGSIGILFEQASSRGHVQNTKNGLLTFEDTIQNQVRTSLSTFAGALANKPAILNYQASFFKDTQKQIDEEDVFGYALKIPKDKGRFNAMTDILDQHNVSFQLLSEKLALENITFAANEAIFVPLDQPNYRLIKSIFSTRKSFADNTFYDVSTWNLPLAFNIDYAEVMQRDRRDVKTGGTTTTSSISLPQVQDNAYAYAIEWHHYYTPAVVQSLLEAGASLRTAGGSFTATLTNGKQHAFSPGTIVIPTALAQPEKLATLLSEASTTFDVPVFSVQTGLTVKGMDLGSRKMGIVELPQVLLVGGRGTDSSEVGEIWHYLDTRVGIPVTITEQRDLNGIDLSQYSHIIFADGRYITLRANISSAIDKWIQRGGVLIGQKAALKLFADQEWLDIDIVSDDVIDDAFPVDKLKFDDKDSLYAKKLIAGAVYRTRIDTTHPLFYGFQNDYLPMFKTNNMIVKSDNSPFATSATYSDNPLMAGYSASELTKLIANTTAVVAQPRGRGVVIGFTDNVNFRGYWYGTSKLMSNAIYQSALLKSY